MVLYALAIPMNGRSISRSVTPNDRRSARFGARWYPDLMSSLRMYRHQNHDTDMFAFQQFYLLREKRRDFILVVVVKMEG
jgi:hypothetical protein